MNAPHTRQNKSFAPSPKDAEVAAEPEADAQKKGAWKRESERETKTRSAAAPIGPALR